MNRWLQSQGAGGSIQLRRNAHRQGRIAAAAMTHGQISDDWATQVLTAFSQNLLQAETVRWITAVLRLAATAEPSESKACQILQRTGETPMGQHSIEAVRRFAHIFNHQNCSTQIGEVMAAEQVGSHRQIHGQQRATHLSARPAGPLKGCNGMTEQKIVKTLSAPGGLVSQGCDQRAVDPASEASCHPAAQQSCDI